MKKFFLAALLLMGFESTQAQISIGLKAGLNSANITGNMDSGANTGSGMVSADRSRMFAWLNPYDREYKLGFHGGLTAHIRVTRKLALQPELVYSRKGYIVDHQSATSSETTKAEVTSRLNYLDLPLMVQFQTGLFYLEAGPQASVLLKQKTWGTGMTTRNASSGETSQVSIWTVSHRNKEGYKSLDLGYGAGLGIKFPNDTFSCGLRYSNSLGTILKYSETDARNSLLQLTLAAKLTSFSG
ncbi:MAG: porin family protein [Adhaeribacter sp.]